MLTQEMAAFTDKDLDVPLSRPTDADQIFRPPADQYRRIQAVRLVFPVEDDHFWEDVDQYEAALAFTIQELVEDAKIRSVETLIYSTAEHVEYVIHADPVTLDGRSVGQTTVQSFANAATKPTRDKVATTVLEKFPESIGVESGTLNLGPLGRSAVATCRLTARKGIYPSGLGRKGYFPLKQVLLALRDADEPFVFQAITGINKHRPQVTARLATFGPDHAFDGNQGLAKIAEEGHTFDLARFYGPYGLSSNYNLLRGLYWETHYRKRTDGHVEFDATISYAKANQYTTKLEIEHTAERLADLIVGDVEFNGLRNGNPSYELAYKECNQIGRVGVDPAQLLLFAQFVPLLYDRDPWRRIPGRNEPQFSTAEIHREVNPAVQGIGVGTDTAPGIDESRVANDGTASHQALLKSLLRWCEEGGDRVEECDQDTSSMSDGKLYTDDGRIASLDLDVGCEIAPMEAEYAGAKPGNLLTNAHRAMVADQTAIFAFLTKADAETALENLSYPISERIDDEVLLYTLTGELLCEDGSIPIAEKGLTSRWFLDAEDTLRLEMGDTERATGPAEDDVGTFEYDGLRYRVVDGDHVIEDADGEIQNRYPTKSRLTDKWTLARRPCVPGAHSYLDHAIVLYYESEIETFHRLRPTPDWDTPDAEGKRKRYKGAVETFIERYLVEIEEAELLKDEFRDCGLAWYRNHSTRKAPDETEFGIAMPNEIPEKGRDGNRTKLLRDRTWIYSPGLQSYHMPGGDGYDEEAEKSSTSVH